MWAWIIRLIGGWIPIGSKPFGEWIGKIIWVVGIILMVSLATNVWDRLFPGKPNAPQFGAGSTYIAGEQRDTIGVGCNIMRLYVKGGLKQK